MSLIKEKIEHLIQNDAVKVTQAGFTKGGKTEDILFILKYCIDRTKKKKNTNP